MKRLDDNKNLTQCGACGEIISTRSFGHHLGYKHALSHQAHDIAFIHGGKHPLCACQCGKETTWNSQQYCFNVYIRGHARSITPAFKRKDGSSPAEKRKKAVQLDPAMSIECKECKSYFKNVRSLSTHVTLVHAMKAVDYTIKHVHNGEKPACKECDAETRFVTIVEGFKSYCIEHATMAMSEGGKIGGARPPWSKGLTKETDERLQMCSEKSKGVNNPFWGKVHSEESKKMIAASKRLNPDEIERRISLSKIFDLVTPIEEYHDRQGQYLDFRCKKCGSISSKTLVNELRHKAVTLELDDFRHHPRLGD